MTPILLNQWFETYKELSLFHRYIALNHITPLLVKHGKNINVKNIGQSVLGNPIHSLTIGKGRRNILMWSQMHGNESTTTKAIFDLCNLFAQCDHELVNNILENCTIVIIPILNPDGAENFNRFNANGIDLNRDAQDLSQPESKILRAIFDDFKPDFCFNLHGQRTIFSAGKCNFPATLSLLAPAQDDSCSVTQNRKKAMEIISAMNTLLQEQIPNQVGIYDDTFNINCVGDTFQTHNVSTILIEAGHYANDYPREKTRKFVFQALLTALHYIATTEIKGNSFKSYFDIPYNEKLFYDILIRNATVNSQNQDIGILYQEKLINNNIEFIPKVEKISDLKEFYGHFEIDANKNEVFGNDSEVMHEGIEIDFVSINNEKISLIVKNN